MIFLSVIIPAYKVEAYLPDCLDSVLVQKTDGFEVIVVDDGSPDGCLALAQAYASRDARLRVITQANAGVSAARNTGLAAAQGEWVWFVDGDDMLAPNAIELLLSNIKPEYDMLAFDYRMVGASMKACEAPAASASAPCAVDKDTRRTLIKKSIYSDAVQCRIPVSSSSFCLYRAAYLRTHQILFQTQLRSGQDGVFHLSALIHEGAMAYLPAVCYCYRRNEGSVSIRYNPSITKAQRLLLEAYKALCGDDTELATLWRCRAINSLRVCLCLYFCHYQNPARYRERKTAYLAFRSLSPYAECLRSFPPMKGGGANALINAFLRRGPFRALDMMYRAYTAHRAKKL